MTSVCPKKFASTLPEPRFQRYLDEAEKCLSESNGNDQIEIAVKLYAWNTALSAAFYEPLQSLEIVLRNTINRQLTDSFGKNWCNDKLNEESIAKLKKGKKKKRNKIYMTDNVIARTSLGFWTGLFHPDYHETLWIPALYKVFPHKRLKRSTAYARLLIINKELRNRIAHHEPIFDRNLEKDMQDILEILGWICPITRDWVKEHNRFDEVMKNCPIKRQ